MSSRSKINNFELKKITKKDLDNLINVLLRCEYTEKSFNKFAIKPVRRFLPEYPIISWRFSQKTPFNIAISLFFLGRQIDNINVKNIFSQKEIENLIKINIFENMPDRKLRSRVMILPYNKYYFVSDFILRISELKQKTHSQNICQENHELVYSISQDSIDLWNAMLKKKVDKTLDLGTGCGFHAIMASSFSKKVIGVDISKRAINFAQFNAQLNNIKNVQFIVGNLYKPVIKEKFDLIISNPPTEISFNSSLVYRSGGIYGNEVLKQVIQALPDTLNKGKYCHIVTKISKIKNKSLAAYMKKWLKGYNFNILFLELIRMSNYQYVLATYQNLITDYDMFYKDCMKLLNHLKKYQINGISYGILTIRSGKTFSYESKIASNLIKIPLDLRSLIREYYKNTN